MAYCGLSAFTVQSSAQFSLSIHCFETNLLNGGLLVSAEGFRSTLIAYVKELMGNQVTPIAATIDWLEQNVNRGQSIWVLPYYSAHPPMYHFPHATYSWQLTWPPEFQFSGLSEIHFLGLTCPDYIIAFGSHRKIVEDHLVF